MNIFKAHNQWKNRPADERFWTIKDMILACRQYRANAAESTVALADLRVEAQDGEVRLVGKTNTPAALTHWCFGQVSQIAKAPASYLRTLPATLAAQNLNYGLKENKPEGEARLLIHRNGSLLCRAATSLKYTRVWNNDILERFERILPVGWRVPPARPCNNQQDARPATEADVFPGTSVRVGDMIAPAGLFASDHDFFLFMVNPERQIDAGYPDHGLMRGVMMWNSEVGAASFGIAKFTFDHVCSNLIAWSVQDYSEMRIRHVGDADDRAFEGIQVKLVEYANESTSDIEAKIKSARTLVLGATKDEAIDAVLGFATKKHIPMTRKALDAAYEIAEKTPRYGSPRTPWGIVNGLTELSQQSGYADERMDLDRAAGKILTMAF